MNQADFSYVLMNPLVGIQWPLRSLIDHYCFFLFMLGIILFLGELPHLLPFLFVFSPENICNRPISKNIGFIFMQSFICILFYLSY